MAALTYGNTLGGQLAEARLLLSRLPSSDLGKLANTVLPSILAGEASHWSYVLLALISHELRTREHGGD